MLITVAGERKDVPAGLRVADLITQERIDYPDYVSVSVNEEFVPREAFATHQLQEGDVVEFLYFMGGGAPGGGGAQDDVYE